MKFVIRNRRLAERIPDGAAVTDAEFYGPRGAACLWVGTPIDSLSSEQVAYHIRTKRKRLLAESDYRAMPDYPQTEATRAAWAAYRQALRDFPATPNLTLETPWPTPPAP